MPETLPDILEIRRLAAPTVTPQALARDGDTWWIGSRDLRRFYCVDARTWTLKEELAAPGIPWAAVKAWDAVYLTSGEGPEDDRYLRRYHPGRGFDAGYRFPLPDLTGSYLSFDGQNLYLSQWYRHRVLQLNAEGGILRAIDIGAEISGHAFADGQMYVLRGTERNGEDWHIARFDLQTDTPAAEPLARMPFACRSLAFDGEHFWTNHRAADQTVEFALPKV